MQDVLKTAKDLNDGNIVIVIGTSEGEKPYVQRFDTPEDFKTWLSQHGSEYRLTN